jgi:hypothetical protein
LREIERITLGPQHGLLFALTRLTDLRLENEGSEVDSPIYAHSRQSPLLTMFIIIFLASAVISAEARFKKHASPIGSSYFRVLITEFVRAVSHGLLTLPRLLLKPFVNISIFIAFILLDGAPPLQKNITSIGEILKCIKFTSP